ncbi:MAG: hypothetical protein WA867_20295 [Candidatus Acidiferrales bacterium]
MPNKRLRREAKWTPRPMNEGPVTEVKRQPLVVEANGGVVADVWNSGEHWVLLDWDNLLGDGADTAKEWNELSQTVQEFIRGEYREDYATITDAIAKNAATSALPKR